MSPLLSEGLLLPTSGTSFCPWLQGKTSFRWVQWQARRGSKSFCTWSEKTWVWAPPQMLTASIFQAIASSSIILLLKMRPPSPRAGADPQTVTLSQQRKRRNGKKHLKTSTAIRQSGFMSVELNNKHVELILKKKKESQMLPPQFPMWNNQGRHVLAHLETPPHI